MYQIGHDLSDQKESHPVTAEEHKEKKTEKKLDKTRQNSVKGQRYNKDQQDVARNDKVHESSTKKLGKKTR